MHEESVTNEYNGKFINEYGHGKHRTGRLPGSQVFDNEDTAHAEARLRSMKHTEPDPLVHGPRLPREQNKRLMVYDAEYPEMMRGPSPLEVQGSVEKLMQQKQTPLPQLDLLKKAASIVERIRGGRNPEQYLQDQLSSGPFAEAAKRQTFLRQGSVEDAQNTVLQHAIEDDSPHGVVRALAKQDFDRGMRKTGTFDGAMKHAGLGKPRRK